MKELTEDHDGIGALVHSEIISQLDYVVDGRKPINPCFLYDLGILTEAICLSDCYTVYFDEGLSSPRPQTDISSSDTLELTEDKLVTLPGLDGPVSTALITGDCVKGYTSSEIGTLVSKEGLNFDYDKFVLDHLYSRVTFNYFEVDEVFHEFLKLHTVAALLYRTNPFFNLMRILQRADITVFDEKGLVPRNTIRELTSNNSDRLTGFSFSDAQLNNFLYDVVEAHELQANCTQDLAQFFHLDDVHLPLLARPMQIHRNYCEAFSGISRMVEVAKTEVDRIEDSFRFRRGYTLLPVPHFARILLSKCKSREDIPRQLIELRERYEPLRKKRIEYNERMKNATVADFQRIDHELETAWTNLLKADEKELSSRLVYRIWDVVKTGPKMLISFVESLRERYELESLGRACGLYDVWSDLKALPVKHRFLPLVEDIFSESIPQKDYIAFVEFCETLEPLLTNRSEPTV